MAIDYEIDGTDRSLLFRSSDQKLFSISKERASQSEVWRGMLEIGNENERTEELDETKAIELKEDAGTLKIFFETLVPSKWKSITLSVSQLINLFRTSDKYQAPNSSVFVPSMAQIDTEFGWSLESILQVCHYGEILNLRYLRDMAAKQFILLGPLEAWKMDKISSASEGANQLAPLITCKQKWNQRWIGITMEFYNCQASIPQECLKGWNKQVRYLLVNAGAGISGPEISGQLCGFHAQELLAHHSALMRSLNSLSL